MFYHVKILDFLPIVHNLTVFMTSHFYFKNTKRKKPANGKPASKPDSDGSKFLLFEAEASIKGRSRIAGGLMASLFEVKAGKRTKDYLRYAISLGNLITASGYRLPMF